MTDRSHTLAYTAAPAPLPPSNMHCLRQAAYAIPDWGQVVCLLWEEIPPSEEDTAESFVLDMQGPDSTARYRLDLSRARAEEIFTLLVRHTVTPCGLADVLEELEAGALPMA